MSVRLKDPDAVEDWTHDWSSQLGTGETIVSSTWAVLPSGELAVDSDSKTTTTTTAVLSGGVAGKAYRVTNSIVTTANQNPQDRAITFRIGER